MSDNHAPYTLLVKLTGPDWAMKDDQGNTQAVYSAGRVASVEPVEVDAMIASGQWRLLDPGNSTNE
jgi:hypothetical protein